ncbi:efflux RND transporter permease subunit [Escherichia coli]|nr:efflux RND transporter permease subunit [Escherichia coli]
MANYFIDRPVFAWVLAIIMMLAGGLAIMNLPVAQYPQIAPPTITVSATYPGADAQTVEDSVTQVIGKRKLTAVCSHQTRIGNLDAHLI